MHKRYYKGKDVHQLACVGTITPGKPFQVTAQQGAQLDAHAPGLYPVYDDKSAEDAARILKAFEKKSGGDSDE